VWKTRPEAEVCGLRSLATEVTEITEVFTLCAAVTSVAKLRNQKILDLLLRSLVCGDIQRFVRAQQEDSAFLDLHVLAGK
jgi:hypothetical protein